MENTEIKAPDVQIDFNDQTGKKVYEIHIKNIIDAIKANAHDPVFMQQIRRDVIFLKWEIDTIMEYMRNPKLARASSDLEVLLVNEISTGRRK